MTNWPRGGYAAGNTPASELKPPPSGMVSKETVPPALDAEPTYTASEVKVLTETATRVASGLALKLGRAEAAEEIAAELRRRSDIGTRGQIRAYADALAGRYATSQGPQAASDATSGVPESSEVGSESQAVSNRLPQEPCGHPTCPCHTDALTEGNA